jgi:hypothetical protein
MSGIPDGKRTTSHHGEAGSNLHARNLARVSSHDFENDVVPPQAVTQ